MVLDKFTITKIVFVANFIFLVVYDLFQVFPKSNMASFSCVINEWSNVNKFIPVIMGMIIGHLFYSSPKEAMNATKTLILFLLMVVYCISFYYFKDYHLALYDKRVSFAIGALLGAIIWPI